MRCRIQLAEYAYEIVHKSGVKNAIADALSRIGSVGALEGPTEIFTDKVKRQIVMNFTTHRWEVIEG